MLLLVGVISLILGSLGASATITTATSQSSSSQGAQKLAATPSKDEHDDNDCDKGAAANTAAEKDSDNDNAECEPGTSSREHEHVKLECSRFNVNDDGGTCALEFTEEESNGSPAANVQVCFTLSAASAGWVSPQCTTTDKNGEADATFHANDGHFGKVTITATTSDDTAKTTVKIVSEDNK